MTRIVAAVALAAVTAIAPPAGATPPGTNGRLAFLLGANDGSFHIYTIEPDGSDSRHVVPSDGGPETAATWDAAWSPDGTQLAFTRDVDGNRDVYVMDADGTDVVRLTRHEAADWGPAWSPNGKRLAFVSDRSGESSIHLMTAEGRYVRRVTRGSIVATSPDWDPRGRHIAFAGTRRRGSDGIFTVRPDGARLRQLSSDGGTSPSWAPRGTRLAYASSSYHEWGDERILLVDRDGGDGHVLAVPPECETEECYMDDPVFSPDGRELAFVFYDRADFTSYIAVTDLHTGDVRELFYEDPGNLFEPSWQSL